MINIIYFSESGIKINPKNKGKFTKSAKAAGRTVLEHARHVLNDPNASKLQKKRTLFAINAKKFKHLDGGVVSKLKSGFDSATKYVSDNYKKFNDGYGALIYDGVNAGLYLTAPFTAGATLPLAIGMSGVLGAANNGLNLYLITKDVKDINKHFIGGKFQGLATDNGLIVSKDKLVLKSKPKIKLKKTNDIK